MSHNNANQNQKPNQQVQLNDTPAAEPVNPQNLTVISNGAAGDTLSDTEAEQIRAKLNVLAAQRDAEQAKVTAIDEEIKAATATEREQIRAKQEAVTALNSEIAGLKAIAQGKAAEHIQRQQTVVAVISGINAQAKPLQERIRAYDGARIAALKKQLDELAASQNKFETPLPATAASLLKAIGGTVTASDSGENKRHRNCRGGKCTQCIARGCDGQHDTGAPQCAAYHS